MENDDVLFEIIARSGNAKECAILAMDSVENNYIEVDKYLDEARSDYKLASIELSKYLKNKTENNSNEVDLLLLHAVEHTAVAGTTIQYALEIVKMKKQISDILKKIG